MTQLMKNDSSKEIVANNNLVKEIIDNFVIETAWSIIFDSASSGILTKPITDHLFLEHKKLNAFEKKCFDEARQKIEDIIKNMLVEFLDELEQNKIITINIEKD